MAFLETLDPLIIAVLAGALGGFTHVVYKVYVNMHSRTKTVKTWNEQFVTYPIHLFLGIIAAVLVWGASEMTNNAVGVFTIAIISGIGAPFIIQRLMEGRATQKDMADTMAQLAKATDAYQELHSAYKELVEKVKDSV